MNHLYRLAVVLATVAALTTAAHAQVGGSESASTTLTLDQALQYALDHYPTVRAALEQVSASTANVSVAKAAYLPRFDALWRSRCATCTDRRRRLLVPV